MAACAIAAWQLAHAGPGLLALRMDAELDLPRPAAWSATFGGHNCSAARAATRYACSPSPSNRIDVTGVETFVRLRTCCNQRRVP